MTIPAIVEWSLLVVAYLCVGYVFVELSEIDTCWSHAWPVILFMLVFWLPWTAVVLTLDWVQERKTCHVNAKELRKVESENMSALGARKTAPR
jgi:hypothetical protein